MKHLHRLNSSLEPPNCRTDFEVASAAAVAALVAAQGSTFGRRSGPAALSPLGASPAPPKPAPRSVPDTRGQGWPSLCVLLFSHTDPSASSSPRLNNQVPTPAGQSLLLSPRSFIFPNNDFEQPLSEEITPPSPTFVLPWIRGFLRTQITSWG